MNTASGTAGATSNAVTRRFRGRARTASSTTMLPSMPITDGGGPLLHKTSTAS